MDIIFERILNIPGFVVELPLFEMECLSIAQRNQALGMIHVGRSTRVVANHFNCHHSTIVRLCQRFAVTNSVADRPRTGRQRVTTRNQDHRIRLAHLRDRFKTATSTARDTTGRHRQRISGQTVRRRLKESRLIARRPYRGPVLTRRHRTQRLQWARGHLQWNRLRWRGVLFSDESRFHLSRSDGRTRIWRHRGERYASCCVEEVDRFGGGSMMTWAAVSFHYKSRLHFCNANLTAQRYRDDILIPYVAPMFANEFECFSAGQCETSYCEDLAKLPQQRWYSSYAIAFSFARPCSN